MNTAKTSVKVCFVVCLHAACVGTVLCVCDGCECTDSGSRQGQNSGPCALLLRYIYTTAELDRITVRLHLPSLLSMQVDTVVLKYKTIYRVKSSVSSVLSLPLIQAPSLDFLIPALALLSAQSGQNGTAQN